MLKKLGDWSSAFRVAMKLDHPLSLASCSSLEGILHANYYKHRLLWRVSLKFSLFFVYCEV